ncbi:MAG: MOSC domain-containing protein [Methylococcales bacterium]|nr:MOSC domain-containing protein [Methylococcales bacterium]
MTNITLSAITLYPVKSLAGISVNSWPVIRTGLEYDRQWMLIDAEQQFLSQRKLPQMVLIKTALTDTHLILSAYGKDDLLLALAPVGGDVIDSQIWADQCAATSVSIEADQWLSDFLKRDCRLVYQPETLMRVVDAHYGLPNDTVAFSDGFPFLIISENSLVSLNNDMALDLPMTRFRPNLVVSGCSSYAEDSWREISIGTIDFRLPKPCSRCSVIVIDPESAEVGQEPLRTLNLTRKWQNKVYFGQNALHDQQGRLTVGDRVHVKVTGDRQPPL